jgi:hypothetical protein
VFPKPRDFRLPISDARGGERRTIRFQTRTSSKISLNGNGQGNQRAGPTSPDGVRAGGVIELAETILADHLLPAHLQLRASAGHRIGTHAAGVVAEVETLVQGGGADIVRATAVCEGARAVVADDDVVAGVTPLPRGVVPTSAMNGPKTQISAKFSPRASTGLRGVSHGIVAIALRWLEPVSDTGHR